MTRTYKMHGQVTTVRYDKWYQKLVVDCGCFWMCHHIDRDEYQSGCYDDKGYFTTLKWITRTEFKIAMKRALQHLKRT